MRFAPHLSPIDSVRYCEKHLTAARLRKAPKNAKGAPREASIGSTMTPAINSRVVRAGNRERCNPLPSREKRRAEPFSHRWAFAVEWRHCRELKPRRPREGRTTPQTARSFADRQKPPGRVRNKKQPLHTRSRVIVVQLFIIPVPRGHDSAGISQKFRNETSCLF